MSVIVIERVLGEPTAHVIDKSPIFQRIDSTGGNLCDGGRVIWAGCSNCNDRRNHDVNRNDVDGAFWNARELFEKPSCVADDDRFRHTEAADPTGTRFCPCGFDN